MYQKIVQLPLFQGLSKETVTKIIEKVKLQFKSLPAQTTFINSGEPCNQLIFVLNGALVKKIESPDKTFKIEQEILSYSVIEPASLFGLVPSYQATYTTSTACDLLIIDKYYILEELTKHHIFKLNFFNILSSQTHNYTKAIWAPKPSNDLLDSFKTFIHLHLGNTSHSITLYIKMEDLAFQLNDTRLNVSKMLNKLKAKNKLALKRKIIHIPDFRLL